MCYRGDPSLRPLCAVSGGRCRGERACRSSAKGPQWGGSRFLRVTAIPSAEVRRQGFRGGAPITACSLERHHWGSFFPSKTLSKLTNCRGRRIFLTRHISKLQAAALCTILAGPLYKVLQRDQRCQSFRKRIGHFLPFVDVGGFISLRADRVE